MNQEQQAIVSQLDAIIIGKAVADAAFRAELLKDPRAVIEREFKVVLPANFNLQVQEAPANTHVITLPYAATVGTDGELSDADLEAVAGGAKAVLTPNEIFAGATVVGLSAVGTLASVTIGVGGCSPNYAPTYAPVQTMGPPFVNPILGPLPPLPGH